MQTRSEVEAGAKVAAAAVLVVMLVLGVAAGAGRLGGPLAAARTIVERIQAALPAPGPGAGARLLPPLEPGPLYVVPGEGILALGENDLVQARSPLAFHTDLISGTVSGLWSNPEGTRLRIEVDLGRAIAAFRAKYPDARDDPDVWNSDISPLLRLGGEYRDGLSPGSSPRHLWDFGIAEDPPVRQLSSLAPELRTVELTFVVTDSTFPFTHPDSPDARGMPRRSVEASVSIPLASPARGELARAVRCDKRAEAAGATVRVSAVAFAADATYVRLDAAVHPEPDTIELGVDTWGVGAVSDVARVVALRDDRGRSYAPLAIPGGARGVRHGLKIGPGEPLTVRFAPMVRDAGAVSLVVSSLGASNESHWVDSSGAVATFAVPRAAVGSTAGGAIDGGYGNYPWKRRMDRATTVRLDQTVTVMEMNLGIVSADPSRLSDGKWLYDIHFTVQPERNGRLLRGLGFGQVARVGLRDWRHVGGWLDLGRRYCDSNAAGGWRVQQPGATADFIRSVDVDSAVLALPGGKIELCVWYPVYTLFGPWEIPLPSPVGAGR